MTALDEKLEKLERMKEAAVRLLDVLSTGVCAETEADADAAIRDAVEEADMVKCESQVEDT